MTTQLTKINPAEYGLDSEKVKSIEDAFMPKIVERDGLAKVYENLLTEDITIKTCSAAATTRKALVKVRTGIASIHKTQKAYFLAAGKFVDAWKNKETLPIVQMEEKLSEIENYYEIQQLKKIEELQTKRVEMLSHYLEDAHERQLGYMEDDVWIAYLNTKKAEYEDRIAAEKKAEQDRIAAEKAEAERLRLIEVENENLKVVGEKAEKERVRVAKVEAEKAAKIKADNEAKLAEQKKESDRLRKIEAEKAEKAAEQMRVKLQAERNERDRINKELEEKKAAELKAISDVEIKKQSELNKGDSAKVQDLIYDLEDIKNRYVFKSVKNQKMYGDVSNLIDKVINHIKN